MKSLVLATNNTHKIKEFKGLFKSSAFNIIVPKKNEEMPKVKETGSTFHNNAFLKAKAFSDKLKNKYWVLSDDSGLEVDILNGEPGVLSARYAGENASDQDNINKLLFNLNKFNKKRFSARFKCVICIIDKKQSVYYFEGICEGNVALECSGKNGFGYDPIFFPKNYSKTFAQLGEQIKSKLSHRAIATKNCNNFFKDLNATF